MALFAWPFTRSGSLPFPSCENQAQRGTLLKLEYTTIHLQQTKLTTVLQLSLFKPPKKEMWLTGLLSAFLISFVGSGREQAFSFTLLVLKCKECYDFSSKVLSVD